MRPRALSFVALTFSNSDLIRASARPASSRPLIALVVGAHRSSRCSACCCCADEAAFVARIKGADIGVDALRRFCGWIAARMVTPAGPLQPARPRRRRRRSASSMPTCEPRYQLADQVPDKQQAVAGQAASSTPNSPASNPIDVLIEFPEGPVALCAADAGDDRRGPRDRREASRASAMSGRSRRCAAGSPKRCGKIGRRDAEAICRAICRNICRAASFRQNQDAVVVEGRVPDIDSSQLLPVVNSLDKSARHGARRASGL